MGKMLSLTDREVEALVRIVRREEARLCARRAPEKGQTVGELFDEIVVCREVVAQIADEEVNPFDAPVGSPAPGATEYKGEG